MTKAQHILIVDDRREIRELVARINAVLRRTRMDPVSPRRNVWQSATLLAAGF